MLTVLVVEPDLESGGKLAEVFTSVFKLDNFKLAHTTQDALAFVYQQEKVDFIISDINHQDIDFSSFFQELRQCNSSADAAIMAIADTVDRDSLVTAAAAGAVDFIARPVNINVLIAKFRRLLHETFQRSSERLAVTGEHQVQIAFSEQAKYSASVADISLGGCQLKSERFNNGGSVFDEVDITIHYENKQVHVKAELVRLERLPKEEATENFIVSAAFQFQSLDEQSRSDLEQLINHLQQA